VFHGLQVMFRPRPASLLSSEQKDAIRKNFRDKYSKKFETADEEV
jgi:hypothetical protein